MTDVLGRLTQSVSDQPVTILPPMEAEDALSLVRLAQIDVRCAMLDPWYNKGVGGIDPNYEQFLIKLLESSCSLAPHVYLWGFPEILAPMFGVWPSSHGLNAWLTWYYKNNPSVIRGWRSAQMTCLHLTDQNATLHPEHFLNSKQLAMKEKGKLRYMPGPTSVLDGCFAADLSDQVVVDDVIEAALNIGFVRRSEQTGHPAQKPLSVYEPLLKMATVVDDLVVDPMAGSGTTGAVAMSLGRRAILSDRSDEYTEIMETRLGVRRLDL